MNAEDRLWLTGVIFLGLGIAADKIVLTIFAIVAFVVGPWLARRAEKDDTEEETPQ